VSSRRRLVIGALVAVVIAVAAGAYVYLDDPEPIEKRGSAGAPRPRSS